MKVAVWNILVVLVLYLVVVVYASVDCSGL